MMVPGLVYSQVLFLPLICSLPLPCVRGRGLDKIQANLHLKQKNHDTRRCFVYKISTS